MVGRGSWHHLEACQAGPATMQRSEFPLQLRMPALHRRPLIALSILAPLLAPASSAATAQHPAHAAEPLHGHPPGRYARRKDVQAWVAQQTRADAPLAAWAAPDLLATLGRAQYQRKVAQLILPAPRGVAKNWAAYRDRFIEPRRLQAGLQFWDRHQDTLARAQTQFGVPEELVLGILGVETFYGQMLGGFRVLDALVTLAFDFPRGRSDRSGFFRDELVQFLLLCRAEGQDPTRLQGSFAGAMGLGQFMPSSWRQFAVDFDGDAHIDLIGNPQDAIGSIANFLRQHGWTAGVPTHIPVDAPADAAQRLALLAGDIAPQWDAAALSAHGVAVDAALAGTLDQQGPWAFIALENGEAAPATHLLGSRNFWVVTRYNRSAYYAMAVIALGERLRQLRQAGMERP